MLCGVYVTPEGTYETDGHQAVMVTAVEQQQALLFDEESGVEIADFFTPFILDRESALKVAKAIPKKTENVEATYAVVDATTENNERAMISVNDIYRQEVLRARKIEGNYPDIAKVIPDADTAKFTLRMNPVLLLGVLKSLQKFCAGHECRSVEVRLFGAGKPIRIDADGLTQKMTAIVMPMRADEEESER